MAKTRSSYVTSFVAGSLVVTYAVSRLVGLMTLPIFCDEAIYIQWAARILRGQLLAPLHDGKLLHVWLIALALPWVSEPLWVARLLAVLEGAIALYACYCIGARLYGRLAGVLCAALYVLCPFTLFYDRMALADGPLSAFAALTLLWSIAVIQDGRRLYVLLLGLAMAAAILCKMPGVLTLLTPMIAAFLLAKPPRIHVARRLALSYCITLILVVVPIVIFLLTTNQHHEKSVLGQNVWALMAQVATNIRTTYKWLWFYWTPPVLILALVGFVFAVIKRNREHLLLGATSLVPIFAFIAISRLLFSRYLLLATVPALTLVAGVVSVDLAPRIARLIGLAQPAAVRAVPGILLCVVVGLFAWKVDWLLLTNPAHAPLPRADLNQYVELWPSGYGVTEATHYLQSLARDYPGGIVVAHHDPQDFGLKVSLMNENRIAVRHLNMRGENSMAKLVAWSRNKPTFVVLNRPPVSQTPSEQPDSSELLKVADLVQSFRKPGGRASVDVYRLK
jgi:Dolichyl-phosphate-mannose-protein mannosyltransferase